MITMSDKIDSEETRSHEGSNTTYSPITLDIRTANASGFRVNKASGEIHGEYVTYIPQQATIVPHSGFPRSVYNPEQYLHLITQNTSINLAQSEFDRLIPIEPKPGVIAPNSRRGPKPKIRLNQHVAIIKIAIGERAAWLENAVMAGIYIAVEASNGKLNIKPRYVRKALTMGVISTDTIARHSAFRNHDLKPVSERYVRYIAAASRVALGSIERFLDQHPNEQKRLEAKVLAFSVWGTEFDLEEGDYLGVD
jgi:hypothetical protein